MMLERRYNKGSAGFSLFELLLVIGLLALMLLGLYRIFDSWAQRAINRMAAAEIKRVEQAASDYVLTNFKQFQSATPNVFYAIALSDLSADGFLPSAFPNRTVFKQKFQVFRRTLRVRRKDTSGANASDVYGNALYRYSIEVVTLSTNQSGSTFRIPNARLLDIARAGGPMMGVVSQMVLSSTTFNNRVTSLYGQWWLPLANLASAGYSSTPNTDGGYLAAYNIVNNEATDTNDAWLYRMNIEDHPELNRMETDLYMGGERNENTGTVVADKYYVTGDVAFLGRGQGTTAESAQAMTVEQALLVEGSDDSRIDMKDTSGGCSFSSGGGNRTLSGTGCSISGGEVQVISAATATNNAIMDMNNLLTDGSIITDITNVDNRTTANGSSLFENVSANTLNNRSQLVSPEVNVSGGSVVTDQMQTATMDLSNGATILGQLAAAKVEPKNGYDFSSEQMSIANTATFNNHLRADALRATDKLYVKSARNFYDTKMGRNIICTTVGARVYCEPNDSSWHVWPNSDREWCTANVSGGYKCTWQRRDVTTGNYQPIGVCRFTRSVGASGQAYHVFSGCSSS